MHPRRLSLIAMIALGCSDYNINSQDKDEPEVEEDEVPDIVVDPERVEFGVAMLPDEVTLSEVVEISNVGNASLDITGFQLADVDAPFAITDVSSELLPPGSTAEVVVSYLALEEGEANTTLWIDSTDPDEPTVGVELIASAELDDGGTDTNEQGGDDCTCPEGFEAREDDSECFREFTEPAIPTGDSYEVCPTSGNEVYGIYGAYYPGGSVVKDTYWGDNDGTPNGRLNEIGVWGCTTSGVPTTGTSPTNTWIGFSVCVELDEPGDYILGLGADNRMRFRVDGVEVFAQTDDDVANFRRWWLNTVELDAGSHEIEIEGYNAGSIGAFGAELAGPFTSGSISDDESMMAVDYDANILWNTADAIGSAFPIGDDVGWECPDGTTFDNCADEPECTGEEVADCEE